MLWKAPLFDIEPTGMLKKRNWYRGKAMCQPLHRDAFCHIKEQKMWHDWLREWSLPSPNMCNPEHVTGVEPMLINVVQQHCNMGEVGGVSWGDWGRGRGSDGSLHDPCSVKSSVRRQSMGEKEWSAPPVSVPTGHWYMILLVRTAVHVASPHLRWWSRGSQALIVA